MKTVVIIPARGGSKGIPRKNLRPLAGKPLIYYSIRYSLECPEVDAVYVSTDDSEIALFAERFGAKVLMRPPRLADDKTTIDPVICNAVDELESQGKLFDIIVTVQPTSPLMTSKDISEGISMFKDSEVETVLSVQDDRHLRWKIENDIPVPEYQKRVNRQSLAPAFKETGAFIACRRNVLKTGTRIGKQVRLLQIEHRKSVDIDSISDFFLCEASLLRKNIIIAVIGSPSVGMGHVFRGLILAHEMVAHDITFICDDSQALAIEKIKSNNYPLVTCSGETMVENIIALKPDLVINDILDTESEYIAVLKKYGCKVVNFEDMGSGVEHADLVINALYPHQVPGQNILVGPSYFMLRDEFLHCESLRDRVSSVQRVLLTFGGVDEGNLTCKVVGAVGSTLVDRGIHIDIVLGPGYKHYKELEKCVKNLSSPKVKIVGVTDRISDYMQSCDCAITSGGRTVMELLSLHVPTIVICQNEREMTHRFASSENGVLNLGLRTAVSSEEICKNVCKVIDHPQIRETMITRYRTLNLQEGKARVISTIFKLLQ